MRNEEFRTRNMAPTPVVLGGWMKVRSPSERGRDIRGDAHPRLFPRSFTTHEAVFLIDAVIDYIHFDQYLSY